MAEPLLTALIKFRAEEHPDNVFAKFRDGHVTWGAFWDRIRRFARGIRAAGVKPGERVALLLPNCPEFLDVFYGVISAGASPVPLNTGQQGETLAYMLRDCGARAIVADASLQQRYDPGGLIEVVRGAPARGSAIELGTLMAAPAELPELDEAPAEGFGIMYTSGTTGPPKGVVQRRTDVSPLLAMWQAMDVKAGETMYTCLPLFHGNPIGLSVTGAMFLDAKVAIGERFSASRFWDEVRGFGAVEFNHVGALIPILLKQPERADDRDNPVRVCLSAGCPPQSWEPFERRFGIRIVEQFSMVDSPGYLLNVDGPAGSMGKPTPGSEAAVLDDGGNEVPPNVAGELCLRATEGRTHDYLNMPDATDEAYRGGWFHTGDLARRDQDGWFYYVGRKRESMRRRGENVSAWEIENVVNQFPQVLESAAHAVPSELGEDDIKVVVVPQPGATVEPRALIDYCTTRMAIYAVPRYVEVREEIPKTPTQRPRYALLKEQGITGATWDRERP
ncbi:MAG: AMP-binding protein [Actinobacteria bacterium]|nr:AMP-binding protein [Actinomycetota bacterium]